MAGFHPRFSLRVGGMVSSTGSPRGAPVAFRVDRSLEVPADGAVIDLADAGGAAPGDPVELDLGDEDGMERVFTGAVAEARPGPGGTRLFAAGTMLGLLHLRVARAYLRTRAGEIVRELAGLAGMEPGRISDGPVLPRFALDRAQGAFHPLRDLGKHIGYSLFADRRGCLHFRGVGAGAPGEPAALAPAGRISASAPASAGFGAVPGDRDLLEIRGRLADIPDATITVAGESPASSRDGESWSWLSTRGPAGTAGAGPELAFFEPLARTKELADRMAAGRLAALGRRRRTLCVALAGRPSLDLGDSLTTAGFADAGLNAAGFVKSLSHRFGPGAGFRTEAVLWVEPEAAP